MDNKPYAIIENNVVVNVVVWNGDKTQWSPPKGTIAVCIEATSIGDGWTYNPQNGEFTKPNNL